MAIAAASPPAPSFCCTSRSVAAQRRSFFQPLSWRARTSFPSARLVARRPAIVAEHDPPSDGEPPDDVNPNMPPLPARGPFPVYVTLPVDTVDVNTHTMKRKKAMEVSFLSLALAGVEGVVMEVWWGVVETYPFFYNWDGYLDVVEMAGRHGLKVRAVLAFHERGTDPNDPLRIPLPPWVQFEMDRFPSLTYADKFGNRSREYISLGSDELPFLFGRTPIQAYSEFMTKFRETFKSFLGDVITGVQVGLGPGGELRYPALPSEMLSCNWRKPRPIGEFQCYDRIMMGALRDYASFKGVPEWGFSGPIGTCTTSLQHDPQTTEFFRSDGGWGSAPGDFFLNWYSNALLLHGEIICREAERIFRDCQIQLLGKITSVHWHYDGLSHASQLTCGYNSTIFRSGFDPFISMFARNNFTVCCPCFDKSDIISKWPDPTCRPEEYVREVMLAAKRNRVSVVGENFCEEMDGDSYKQVIKMVAKYCDGVRVPSFTFNIIRMDEKFFYIPNWNSFTRFVRMMSTTTNIHDLDDKENDNNNEDGGGGGGGDGGGKTSSPLAVAAFPGDGAVNIS